MLSVMGHEQNTNQIHSMIPFVATTWLELERQTVVRAGPGVEEQEPASFAGGNVTWCSCFGGEQCGTSSKC